VSVLPTILNLAVASQNARHLWDYVSCATVSVSNVPLQEHGRGFEVSLAEAGTKGSITRSVIIGQLF